MHSDMAIIIYYIHKPHLTPPAQKSHEKTNIF